MKDIKKEECFSYAVIYSCLAGAVSGLMMVIGYAIYHYYEYYNKLALGIPLDSGEKTHYFSSVHFYLSAASLLVLFIFLTIFSIRCIICLKRYGKLYMTLPSALMSWAALCGTSSLISIILLDPIIFPY